MNDRAMKRIRSQTTQQEKSVPSFSKLRMQGTLKDDYSQLLKNKNYEDIPSQERKLFQNKMDQKSAIELAEKIKRLNEKLIPRKTQMNEYIQYVEKAQSQFKTIEQHQVRFQNIQQNTLKYFEKYYGTQDKNNVQNAVKKLGLKYKYVENFMMMNEGKILQKIRASRKNRIQEHPETQQSILKFKKPHDNQNRSPKTLTDTGQQGMKKSQRLLRYIIQSTDRKESQDLETKLTNKRLERMRSIKQSIEQYKSKSLENSQENLLRRSSVANDFNQDKVNKVNKVNIAQIFLNQIFNSSGRINQKDFEKDFLRDIYQSYEKDQSKSNEKPVEITNDSLIINFKNPRKSLVNNTINVTPNDSQNDLVKTSEKSPFFSQIIQSFPITQSNPVSRKVSVYIRSMRQNSIDNLRLNATTKDFKYKYAYDTLKKHCDSYNHKQLTRDINTNLKWSKKQYENFSKSMMKLDYCVTNQDLKDTIKNFPVLKQL